MVLREPTVSLATRIAIILAVTLIAAQTVNFYVFTEQRRIAVIQVVTSRAVEGFVELAMLPALPDIEEQMSRPPRARPGPARRRPPPPRPRDDENLPPEEIRFLPADGIVWKSDTSIGLSERPNRDPTLRRRVLKALEQNNIEVTDVVASYNARGPRGRRIPGTIDAPPPESANHPKGRPPPVHEIRIAARLKESGVWLNGIFPAMPPPPRANRTGYLIGAGIFAVFLTLAIGAIAVNIARPLKDLSQAAERIGLPSTDQPVPVRGPTEIQNVITAFNKMNSRVTELLKEKDILLGALGHDLRTPLTSLRLRAEQIQPDELRATAIQTLDETATLIEDILALARANGAEIGNSVFDIRSIVQDIIADYRDLDNNVVLSETPRIVARCKPAAIQRMMRNLIDNALKYAGSATVHIRRQGELVYIVVEDEGPGIPEEIIEHLIQPFKRGEKSRSRSTGGAGLGLAIARAVAKSHGGDLIVENRQRGGLRATATIQADAN